MSSDRLSRTIFCCNAVLSILFKPSLWCEGWANAALHEPELQQEDVSAIIQTTEPTYGRGDSLRQSGVQEVKSTDQQQNL